MLKRAWKPLRMLPRRRSRNVQLVLWNVIYWWLLGSLRTVGLLRMTAWVRLRTQLFRQLLLGIRMLCVDVLNDRLNPLTRILWLPMQNLWAILVFVVVSMCVTVLLIVV